MLSGLPLVAVPVLSLLAFLMPDRSLTAAQCPQCGYNMTGLRRQRCPECGHEREDALNEDRRDVDDSK